ncbi:hypothetical protein D3C84_1258670 [compost metagenome]
MQSPMYRLEILDLLKKAVQEELKPKPDEKVKKSGEGGDQQSEEQQSDSGGSDSDSGDSENQDSSS